VGLSGVALTRRRSYQGRCKKTGKTAIGFSVWASIQDVRINHPKKLELLQVADITASSVLKAFQPDRHGVTEQRYLTEFAPRLYRRPPGALTSYGMKLHPSSARASFPWLKHALAKRRIREGRDAKTVPGCHCLQRLTLIP